MDDNRKKRMRNLGFAEQVDNLEQNLCVFCKSNKIKPEDFKDNLSRREFEISGMCQECMDKIFDQNNRK